MVRLGLIEYVDNPALVTCCSLDPYMVDDIIYRFEQTCQTNVNNPRYEMWLIFGNAYIAILLWRCGNRIRGMQKWNDE